MKYSKTSFGGILTAVCAAVIAASLSACDSTQPKTDKTDMTPTTPHVTTPTTPTTPTVSTPTVPVSARPTIRVKCGWENGVFTDSKGVKWEADKGYEGGTAEPRQDTLEITSPDRPEMFKTERYWDGDGSYSFDVPNGKYLVNLYFSEDYEGVTDENGRMFTFAIKDGAATGGKVVKEVKDFSPWKKGGGFAKGYIEKTDVNVTSGKISITFTSQQVQNPQINAIEIVPE